MDPAQTDLSTRWIDRVSKMKPGASLVRVCLSATVSLTTQKISKVLPKYNMIKFWLNLDEN
jgi:hypothetical protein